MDITRQEARQILGIDELFKIVNSRKPGLTVEQRRSKLREELKQKDLQRAKDLGIIKPVFRNGIVCKGERIASNKSSKTSVVLFKTREKTR